MKKYVKPELIYENFELSQSVAGSCSAALNHTENSCTLDPHEAPGLYLESGENVFNSQCYYRLEELGNEDYCYWSGNSINNIFTS